MLRRKHKSDQNSKKKNDFNIDFSSPDVDEEMSDADLEAELNILLKAEEVKAKSKKMAVKKLSDNVDGVGSDMDESGLEVELDELLSVKTSSSKMSASSQLDDQKARTSTIPAIQSRKKEYEEVIANMKAAESLGSSESSILRMYERALVTVNTMESQASRGKKVELESLPPPPKQFTKKPVVKRRTGQETVLDYLNQDKNPSAKPPTSSSVNPSALEQLKDRFAEYKNAVLEAEKNGDMQRVNQILPAVKALEVAIPRIETGQEPFDPSEDMPPPVDIFCPPCPSTSKQCQQLSNSAVIKPSDAAMSGVASSESLTARIEFLQALIKQAEDNNDPRKRMYQRTLDSYNNALRAFQRGVHFDFAGLFALPNCPQFRSVASVPSSATGEPVGQPICTPLPGTANQRLVALLKKRQFDLRSAAARAKASGDLNRAKEYLRGYMNMSPLVKAAEAGLPVDLKRLPPAPGSSKVESDNLPILSGKPCDPPIDFQTSLLGCKSLDSECALLMQVLMEQSNEAERLSKEHHDAGFVQMADKLLNLCNISRQFLSYVEVSRKRNKKPKYCFELANLSQLNINPDLGEGTIEATVTRGISLPLPPGFSTPEELDTYVTLEFPFPSSENPQKHSTSWAKHTNEPDNYGGHQATARFEVTGTARSYERILTGSKSLKVTVYYNRGLLKKAGILGTANVKLNELAMFATSKAAHQLMDGRKAAGGFIEIQLRHRAPVTGSKFSVVQKPWLIIQTSKSASLSGLK